MPKFKVTSGEFEVVVEEKTHRKAGDLAIKLHDESNHPGKLGDMTLIEKLDRQGRSCGEFPNFIATQHLLDDNTAGFGDRPDQYHRLTDTEEQE